MSRGRPRHEDVLTPAEWQVLFFMRKGLTNRLIAARHGTSSDEVKYHVSNMLGKLALASRWELASWGGHPAIAVARAKGARGMQVAVQAPPLYVHDLPASVGFYEDALGFTISRQLPEVGRPAQWEW